MSTGVAPPTTAYSPPPGPRRMTTEELLALPDDGVERWLINGELREKPMTVRHRFHSSVMVCVSTVLKNWRDQQPEPRGVVYCGEAGVRLHRNPDTTVGVDVTYVPPKCGDRSDRRIDNRRGCTVSGCGDLVPQRHTGRDQ